MSDDEETRALLSNDAHSTSDKRCEYCGATIETGDWYPVTKERDADGSLQIYNFCGHECRERWHRA